MTNKTTTTTTISLKRNNKKKNSNQTGKVTNQIEILRLERSPHRTDMPLISAWSNLHAIVPSLNGTNGEWTNSDDVKGQKGKKSTKGKSVKNAPRKGKHPRPTSVLRPPPGLTECANKYALAIATPWDPKAEGACIPTFPSKASQKNTAWIRGSLTIGTGGFGFVIVAPCLANNAGLGCAFYTNSTYSGTSVLATSSSIGTTVNSSYLNTPWAATNFVSSFTSQPPAISGRIVSAGLSLCYTGSELNLGGEVFALVEPNHGNLNGFTQTGLLAYKEAKIIDVTSERRCSWITTSGIDSNEVQYPNSTDAGISPFIYYPFSQNQILDTSISNTGGAPLCFQVTGTLGNTYRFEYVQHTEFIGANASPMATPTHSDARGFEMVNTAANRIPQMSVANKSASTLTLMSHALRDVIHESQPAVTQIAKGLGRMALSGAATYFGGPAAGAAAYRITGG